MYCMKRIVASILLLGVFNISIAQDKASEKEWKKKLKEMDPMVFKNKMTELDSLRKEEERQGAEIDELRTKNEELTKVNESQKQTIDSLKAIAHSKPAKSTTTTGLVAAKTAPVSTANSGVVFKVQIGAFKNKALEKYFNNTKNFSGDVDNDGTKKYTLGHFIEYWEADNFKRYLREMGVADAWIVAYKNGERVDIKDVLEGVVK